jgi:phosphoglycolate phosphatase
MKLVIFDVDGTLMDSQVMIVASLSAAFTGENLPVPDRSAMLSIIGLSLFNAMQTLRPEDEEAVHHRLAERYKQAFWGFRQGQAHPELPYDGAFEALRRLKARNDVTLGIATGKSQRGVRHIVDQFGLEGIFSTIQTSDDAPSKPHPAMILQAIDAVGADPRDTTMIGDAVFDMQMAGAAGVHAIGVSWGFQPVERLRAAGAKTIIDNYGELDGALELLWRDRAA